MSAKKIVLLTAFAALCIAAKADPIPVRAGSKFTEPQAPKIKPAPELRLFPDFEVPPNPERYIWKVVNKSGGKAATDAPAGSVPIYEFDGWHLIRRASIAEGTTITLNEVRTVGRTHYYAVPMPPIAGKGASAVDGRKPDKGWISGLYIQAAGLASPAQ